MTITSGESLTPLLEFFDPKLADDIYLRALAEEYLATTAFVPGDLEQIIEITDLYAEGMGIISSNNLHLWFNDSTFDPDDPNSGDHNINNPDHALRPEIQGLLVLHEEQPELFKKIRDLSLEFSGLSKRTFDNAMGRILLTEPEQKELKIKEAISSFQLGIAKTQAIKILQEMGISEEDLGHLYE